MPINSMQIKLYNNEIAEDTKTLAAYNIKNGDFMEIELL
jgi:hypothetical protein